MITLHHLVHSRSFRILWLLEELKDAYGLDYTLVSHARGENLLAPPVLLDIHPMGKAPILIDTALGDTDNALAESALIIEYLLVTYDSDGKFHPTDTGSQAWRAYTFWLHFAEGSLMPPLVTQLILSTSAKKAPFFLRPIIKALSNKINALILSGNVKKSLALLASALESQHWLTGDHLTGADIQLYFAALAADKRAGLSDEHAPIINWMRRCESRPAFMRALALGGAPLS